MIDLRDRDDRAANFSPDRPRADERDRFPLSNGHAAIGLYAVPALQGYLPIDQPTAFNQLDSRLQAHPDMRRGRQARPLP